MAGTLLHITLANQALRAAAIPPGVESEIRQCIDDFRLGAVLVDLPYFERLWLNGLRTLAGLDIRYGVWGNLLHVRSPLSLVRAMLDRAGDACGRARALGFVTHMAVDVIFHKEIHRRTIAGATGSMSLDNEHKQIEDQMDLHVHYHILGHSGIGTPYADRMLVLKPDNNWCRSFFTAVKAVHGNAPDENRLRRWLKGLALFGRLHSTGRVPWVTTLPRDNPELSETAIGLAEEAIQLSSKYIEISVSYINGDMGWLDLQSVFPDRSMLDGVTRM